MSSSRRLRLFIVRDEDVERILNMKLGDLVSEVGEPLVVDEDMPVDIFIDSMRRSGKDCAVVLGRDNKVRGIITLFDLLKILELREHRHIPFYRLAALPLKGIKGRKIMVGDIMTRHPIVLESENTVRDAIDLMIKLKISHVIVMEGNRVVGVISKRHILSKIFGLE